MESVQHTLRVSLRGRDNETYSGTLVIRNWTQLLTNQAAPGPATNSSSSSGIEDPTGASYYVVAVVMVYGFSIVMLIASHIKRKHTKLQEDRQINKYLQEFMVVQERSSRDSYKRLKRSIIAKLHRDKSCTSRSLSKALFPVMAVALPNPMAKQRRASVCRMSTSRLSLVPSIHRYPLHTSLENVTENADDKELDEEICMESIAPGMDPALVPFSDSSDTDDNDTAPTVTDTTHNTDKQDHHVFKDRLDCKDAVSAGVKSSVSMPEDLRDQAPSLDLPPSKDSAQKHQRKGSTQSYHSKIQPEIVIDAPQSESTPPSDVHRTQDSTRSNIPSKKHNLKVLTGEPRGTHLTPTKVCSPVTGGLMQEEDPELFNLRYGHGMGSCSPLIKDQRDLWPAPGSLRYRESTSPMRLVYTNTSVSPSPGHYGDSLSPPALHISPPRGANTARRSSKHDLLSPDADTKHQPNGGSHLSPTDNRRFSFKRTSRRSLNSNPHSTPSASPRHSPIPNRRRNIEMENREGRTSPESTELLHTVFELRGGPGGSDPPKCPLDPLI